MEKGIKYPVVLFAITIFCLLLFIPLFENEQAQRALALLVLVAVLWISEAVPLSLTALMIPVLATLLHLAQPIAAFSSFANPVIFLFMGGFVLAGALSRHGFDKLLAGKLISLAKGNFYKSSVLLMLATSLAACWISNTSSTAIMIPLALGMLALVKKNIVSGESKFLMLGIAYSANLGGIITMVGSPPNAIGAAILGMSFLEWIKYALPLFIITFPIMVVVLTWYFKPDRKMNLGEMASIKTEGAPNKTLAFIFVFTVALWVLDSVIAPALGITENFNALVAVFAIMMVFMFRVLNWDELLASIRWDVLLLFGGGLTLGMIIDKSGLGALLVGQVAHLITAVPLFVFLWVIVLFSILLTEFMSNTASAALILPLLYTLAVQLDINPMVLVFPATIAASYGFMMPAGTPPNAMVFSSGYVPQKDMMKAGLALNLIFSLVLTLFFYLIFKP